MGVFARVQMEHISEFIFQSSPEEHQLENFKNLDAEVILADIVELPFRRNRQKNYGYTLVLLACQRWMERPRVWYLKILERKENGELKYTHQYLEVNDFQKAYHADEKVIIWPMEICRHISFTDFGIIWKFYQKQNELSWNNLIYV